MTDSPDPISRIRKEASRLARISEALRMTGHGYIAQQIGEATAGLVEAADALERPEHAGPPARVLP